MKSRSELSDEEYRELVLKARQMSFDKKLFIGFKMFEEEAAQLRLEFSEQFPLETPERIQARVNAHYEAIRAAEPNPYTILPPEEAAKYL